jgi:ABC-type spermidine/putrescine transport system permease subunit II
MQGARTRRLALGAYAALFYAFLYLPILLLVVLSVNDSQVIGLPFRGFTWRWFQEVWTTPALVQSIVNSAILGAASAVIATILALMLALAFRAEFPGKALLMKALLLPILIPGIVGGIIYLIFFGMTGVPVGLWPAVLIAHVTWVLPFAFLTLFPRLHGFDRSIEEAAMDLGATPWDVFRLIVLPLIRPGLIATAMFAFTLSFDEFIRTLFVIGNDRTVPVQLWTLLSDQMAPFLPAVGVVVMAVSIFVSLMGFIVSARASRGGPPSPSA